MKKITHIIIALFSIVLTSCLPDLHEFRHRAVIRNKTDDTIWLEHPFYYRHFHTSRLDTITVNPHSSGIVHSDDYIIFDILKRDSLKLDTLKIYRKDSLLIEWYPPLRKMSKDSNSFYNENSWVRKKSGEWCTVVTLTITEDDYGHAF